MATPSKDLEDSTTRFKKGSSGNPTGRPKGKVNKSTELARKFQGALEKDALDVIRAILDAAKGGDMTAAKMVLDRIIPPKKAIDPNAAKSLDGKINIIIGDLPGRPAPAIEVSPTIKEISHDEE